MMLYEEAINVMNYIESTFPDVDVDCRPSSFDEDGIIRYLLIVRKVKQK